MNIPLHLYKVATKRGESKTINGQPFGLHRNWRRNHKKAA